VLCERFSAQLNDICFGLALVDFEVASGAQLLQSHWQGWAAWVCHKGPFAGFNQRFMAVFSLQGKSK
jgi:hypothetical protein